MTLVSVLLLTSCSIAARGQSTKSVPSQFEEVQPLATTVETEQDTSIENAQTDSGDTEGYILFAPLRSTTSYLINYDGDVFHTWPSEYNPGNAVYLLENGNLLRTGSLRSSIFEAGGSGGIVQEISWDDLLENLRQYRFQLSEVYKETTNKILAGILVTQVIQDAHHQEDEKIRAALRSSIVQKPLFEITKKYDQVTFDGENLRVSDKYEEFYIADLSTAAKEQVLLALRLGFAAKIMKQETAFLILDDAFQHSDWLRREYLLDTVISLANNGWQIIYFTMDDHIRDLFDELGKETFKSDYCYFELQTKN